MGKPRKLSDRDRCLEDLKRSGLDKRDAQLMRVELLSSEQVKKLTGFTNAPAYKLPYLDHLGKLTKFCRLRFLTPVKLTRDKKPLRYWQPASTLPRAYFAPHLKWPAVISDAEKPIIITEGEKKAAAACKVGLACVGLGGVWSWKSKTAGLPLLPELEVIAWSGRDVTIIFDSDVMENEQVQRALQSLSSELTKRGAVPHALVLPSLGGEKTGLDDFIASRGHAELLHLEREPLTGQLAKELWSLNDELAYVEESEAILKLKTEKLLNKPTLVTITYANRTVLAPDERGNVTTINLADAWLRWPLRRTHTRVTYEPGQARVTDKNEYNLWNGWGLEPVKGDITPWAQLMEYMFRSAPEHLNWFLKWLAYPIQHPGTKLYTAAVILSLKHGVGKSLMGMTLGKIYGQHFSMISQEQLAGQYNELWSRSQFVLGDEITGSDRRRDADLIKNLVTRETITVNQKYQPSYVIRDCTNYLFTTNHPDAFFFDDNDRRFFVHEVAGDPLPQRFYDDYDRWFRRGNGPAALFHHLLENISTADFNPRARAPFTSAKLTMASLSLSDHDAWARALREDPDSVLRIGGTVIPRDLWTITELHALLDPKKNLTENALARSLRRAGFDVLPPTKTAHGMRRLWIVRNPDRWKTATHSQRAVEYERERKASVKITKF